MLAYSYSLFLSHSYQKDVFKVGTHNPGTHIPRKDMYTREQGQAAVLVLLLNNPYMKTNVNIQKGKTRQTQQTRKVELNEHKTNNMN